MHPTNKKPTKKGSGNTVKGRMSAGGAALLAIQLAAAMTAANLAYVRATEDDSLDNVAFPDLGLGNSSFPLTPSDLDATDQNSANISKLSTEELSTLSDTIEYNSTVLNALTKTLDDLKELNKTNQAPDLKKIIDSFRALQQTCRALFVFIDDSSGSVAKVWAQIINFQQGLLNAVDISPTGSSASVIAFSNYVTTINMSNNLQTLDNEVNGLQFQGGGTKMAPALQAAYDQLVAQAGQDKSIPRRIVIMSDFMVDDEAQVQANFVKIVDYASANGLILNIELLAVAGIDGLNNALVNGLQGYGGVINTLPKYSSLEDLLNQQVQVAQRLCPPLAATTSPSGTPTASPSVAATVAPTAAPTKGSIPPTFSPTANNATSTYSNQCQEGFSLLANVWPALFCIPFIPPLVRKRQEFVEPDEADPKYLAAKNKLATKEEGGFASVTRDYQRQVAEHKAATEKYQRDLARYQETVRSYEAELAARKAAGPLSRKTGEDAAVKEKGAAGWTHGLGAGSGAGGSTSGIFDHTDPRVNYKDIEADMPAHPTRPTPPGPAPVQPTERRVTNLVYVGTSTPLSLLPITLIKGSTYRAGFDLDGRLGGERAELVIEEMPRNFVPQAVKNRLPDKITGGADAALNLAGKGLNTAGKAIPTPIAMLGNAAIGLADSALRFASLSGEQRMLQKGDTVQFDADTGEMLRIARQTDKRPPNDVMIIDLVAATYTPAAKKTMDRIRQAFKYSNATIPVNTSPDATRDASPSTSEENPDDMVDIDLEAGAERGRAVPAPFLPSGSAVFDRERQRVLAELERMRLATERQRAAADDNAEHNSADSDSDDDAPRPSPPPVPPPHRGGSSSSGGSPRSRSGSGSSNR